MSLPSPELPGNEADGTREQTSPVGNKHTHQYSVISLLICMMCVYPHEENTVPDVFYRSCELMSCCVRRLRVSDLFQLQTVAPGSLQ